MLYCWKCKTNKLEDEFAFKNRATGQRQSHCRGCQKAYRRDHYERNRQKYIDKAQVWSEARLAEVKKEILEYLSEHPCVDCGEPDPEVLQFDHRDEKTKTAGVSRLMHHHRSWLGMLREIEKCDVRCANCHVKRTNRQFGYWRYLATLV